MASASSCRRTLVPLEPAATRVERLVAALRPLAEPAVRTRMGEAARERVEALFSLAVMRQEYEVFVNALDLRR